MSQIDETTGMTHTNNTVEEEYSTYVQESAAKMKASIHYLSS